MKTCTRCGASPYVDADLYCEHAYHEPPEPEVEDCRGGHGRGGDGETIFRAYGVIAGSAHAVEHPTRDGAIALWQERRTWGPAIAALFGWLCGPRFREPALAPFARAHLARKHSERIAEHFGFAVTIPPNATVTRASATTSRGEPIGVCLGDGPPDAQGRPTVMVQLNGPRAAMTEAERRELMRRLSEEAKRPATVQARRCYCGSAYCAACASGESS